MDECINREAAIRALLNDSPEQVSYSREDAADCIRYMDAADVATVRHGRWIDSLARITPYCSACGHSHRCLIRTPNYCPNCGAKMDDELNE